MEKKTDDVEKLPRLYIKEVVSRHGIPISIVLIEVADLPRAFRNYFKRHSVLNWT